VSESHLGKVLRALGKKGFLTSTRGPHGGFSILDNTPKASVLSVLEAIDGPFTSPSCQITQPACRADGCALLHLAAEHHENLVHRLNNLSIGAMAKMG
jgi:Rrf2 family protein